VYSTSSGGDLSLVAVKGDSLAQVERPGAPLSQHLPALRQ
jgi:hypothetical protein